MGKKKNRRRAERSLESPAVPLTSASLEALFGSGTMTATGVHVTRERGLQLLSVAACVRVLSEDVAALPLHLYRRLNPRGKERAHDHPVYELLHRLPNPEMTAFELRETLVGHLLTWGWGYCEIEYDRAGRRRGLWPLRPDRIRRIPGDGDQTLYEVTLPDGKPVFLKRWQVWAIRGWSLEAWEAESLIHAGREAIGLGIAAEEYGSRFFGNDSRPGGVLEHPGKLSSDASGRMRKSWNDAHSGLSNAHRVAILEEGVKWHQIGIAPENAQFLETRKFQRSEIAGLFRVPPHKIGDLEKATFSNIEQQSIDYVNDALVPICTRIEQAADRDLLSPAERTTYFAEHLLAGRMRGEMLARYQAYAVGMQNSWLCADDIREMENMNPLPDGLGQQFYMPMNMKALGDDSTPPDAPAQDDSDEEPQGKNSTSEEQRSRRRMEQRSVATSRKKIGESFAPAVQAVAQRMVNREANDIANAKRWGREKFKKWVGPFVESQAQVVHEYMAPTMRTFADQVIADVERETGREAPAGVARFADGYIQSRAEIWVEGLRRGLKQVDEGEYETEEEWAAALDEFLATRKKEQAEDWAREEATRMLGAVARVAYEAMGVMLLMWMVVGETCPYCDEWDGRTISITESFLAAGDELAPEGEERFHSDTDVGHPPLHRGCDCVVVAA